jgi:hypothetical protein
LFAWQGPDAPFRFDLFYKKSIFQDDDESQDYVFSAVTKLKEFQNSLRRKEAKRRTTFRVNFKLPGGVEIAVIGYGFKLIAAMR